MLGKTYENQNCSAARALEVVGERWSLLIMRDVLFRGKTRFSDFQRGLGLASNVLAARLDGFVSAGLLERRSSRGQVDQAEYVVTEKGDRWVAPHGPPISFQHAGCGGKVAGRIACHRCGESPNFASIGATPTRV
jgi:DNA-binding HxlR family transcriptional regulator